MDDALPELNVWRPGGAAFNGPIAAQSATHPVFQRYSDENDIQAAFIQALELEGRWWGYITVTHHQARSWNPGAVQLIQTAAEVLVTFVASMSHELRTPLNAVIGIAALLQETALTDEQRGFTAIINTGGQALLAVIGDILDFSRIESGHLELEAAPFDLPACLTDAVALIAPGARQKGGDRHGAARAGRAGHHRGA